MTRVYTHTKCSEITPLPQHESGNLKTYQLQQTHSHHARIYTPYTHTHTLHAHTPCVNITCTHIHTHTPNAYTHTPNEHTHAHICIHIHKALYSLLQTACLPTHTHTNKLTYSNTNKLNQYAYCVSLSYRKYNLVGNLYDFHILPTIAYTAKA